jgi:hypothetical protein
MKAHSRLVLFSLITILVFLFNLALPVAAFADDGAPPDAAPTEAPVVTTDSSPADAAPTANAMPVDLPAVLEQAPADTQVVVVNDAGQAEPLATTAAAEILQTGDPVWCPAGQVPTPGANGCTAGAGTMALLVTQLSGGGYSGNGIIWVESGYAGADNSTISFDHDNLATLGDLTVQGGWDGVSGNTTIGAAPVFDVPLNIIHWRGNIAINNLTFTGAGAYLDSCDYNNTTGLCEGTGNIAVADSTFNGSAFNGLVTDSGGSTALTNVTASGNNLDGALITAYDDSAAPHNVTVTNSTFSNNVNGTGIDVLSDGDVTLNNVTADGNKTGAIIDTTPGVGNVTVNGGRFNGNAWSGLDAYSAGNITVAGSAEFSNTSFPGHDAYGAYLDATYGTGGSIDVSDSTFVDNDGYGLFGVANKDVTLTNLTVDGYDSVSNTNVTDVGAWIKAINGAATVDGGLSGVFMGTTKTGLIAIGGLQVDLVNVTVTASEGDGAQVYSTFTYACFGSTGIQVNVNGGDYSGNSGPGLTIKPGPEGSVTVSGTPYFDANEEMVVDLGNPCLDKDEEKPVEEGKPVNIVEVPFKDGAPVQQDCTAYSGTALVLPDGSWVKFGCPFDGSMSLEGLLKEELPGPLGAGAEFVSAISYGMTGLDNALVTVNPDGTITIKFNVPADSKARAYDILYWDPTANNGAGAWITLPQYKKFGQQPVSLNPDDSTDQRLVTRGVKQEDGYVTVTVNFTGIFVLVAR